jgi:hypothetical protein
MPRRLIYRALRSTRLQLALTLAALLASAVLLLTFGLPPTKPIFDAALERDLDSARRCFAWGIGADARNHAGDTPLLRAVGWLECTDMA